MRITMRFIGVLAAVLLIAVPAMGISAQGGTEVASPVSPETGTGGEIQALTEGLLYKGSGYMPAGIATPVTPKAMPQTGSGEQPVTMVSTWVWDGFDWVFLTIPAEPTLALPRTGSDLTGGAGWAILDPTRDCRWCQATPELTEFEWQLRLNEMIAGGVGASGGSPEALPESGSEGAAELGFIGVIGHDGMSAAGINEASYLWDANAGLGRTASGSPKALPLTGTSPSEPPYYEALPAFLASASTNGKTGQDTQTILDGIAGGVRNITEILPEELAAAGR